MADTLGIGGQGRPSPPGVTAWSRAQLAEEGAWLWLFSDVFLVIESRTFHLLQGYLYFIFSFFHEFFMTVKKGMRGDPHFQWPALTFRIPDKSAHSFLLQEGSAINRALAVHSSPNLLFSV